MDSLYSPRRVLIAYTVGGLAIGILVSVVVLYDAVSNYRWQPDGTLNARTPLPDLRIDPREVVGYPNGRPMSLGGKLALGTVEAMPILIVSAFVGLCWGYVHLKMREWIADPFGDLNKLDYEELADRPCPHGMT